MKRHTITYTHVVDVVVEQKRIDKIMEQMHKNIRNIWKDVWKKIEE